MPKNIKIYVSKVCEAPFNLAFEQFIFEECSEDEVVLYLWQNEKTIVVGRHQNPYKECNLELLQSDGINLVRRLSGGGAVYHDLGNLNFTFISHSKNYDVNINYNIILDALKKFGLNGEISGRNDLTINGAKFSGNAFMSDDGFNCHHGTLLIDADMNALSRYLTPSNLKISSKGIDSVKSRVTNLKDLNPDISVNALINEIISSFYIAYEGNGLPMYIDKKNVSLKVLEKERNYADWEWNYANTPGFDISYEAKFSWGVFELDLNFENSLITQATINTDCILKETFEKLEANLIGKKFIKQELKELVNDSLTNPVIKEDIYLMLDSEK